MSKKKYIGLGFLLSFIIFFVYINKYKELNRYFNKNELKFTYVKEEEVYTFAADKAAAGDPYDYYYLLENYKGDYQDLKKIYKHSISKKPDEEPFADRYDTAYEGYIFYGIAGIFVKEDGLSGLDFLYAFDGLYHLNQKDISVEDFKRWASFIVKASENIDFSTKTTETLIYHLYNKDKTQHITMNCYDFCRRFDFIME